MQTPRNKLLPFDPLAKAAAEAVPSFIRHAIASTKPSDMALIRKLLERAVEVAAQRRMLIPSTMQLGLDLALAHARRPLHLARLVISSDQDVYDEVRGISQHIDRQTGEMRDGWESHYWVDRSPLQ